LQFAPCYLPLVFFCQPPSNRPISATISAT
jgi:hypothetical protein